MYRFSELTLSIFKKIVFLQYSAKGFQENQIEEIEGREITSVKLQNIKH